LIQNGDFELITNCPVKHGDLFLESWTNTVEKASADLYSNCSQKSAESNPKNVSLTP